MKRIEQAESLMTLSEVASYLRVNRDTVTRMRKDRLDPIPYLRVGKQIRFDKNAVIAWAERRAREDGGADAPPMADLPNRRKMLL